MNQYIDELLKMIDKKVIVRHVEGDIIENTEGVLVGINVNHLNPIVKTTNGTLIVLKHIISMSVFSQDPKEISKRGEHGCKG